MTGFRLYVQIIYMIGTKSVTIVKQAVDSFGQEKITIGVTLPHPGFFVTLFAA